MKSTILLKKFWLDHKQFIKAKEMKNYCRDFNLDYEDVIGYFLSRGYLIRLFRGIFYIKTPEEIELGTKRYSTLELISKALELKGVNNWYFSLFTALRLNNATHEYFNIIYVISDKLYRSKIIHINNRKVKFIKLKPQLLTFGIIKNGISYSNIEKTILDFIYLGRYNSKSKERIILDISDYLDNASIKEDKINRYANNYPASIKEIVDEVL